MKFHAHTYIYICNLYEFIGDNTMTECTNLSEAIQRRAQSIDVCEFIRIFS